ncbi:MAG: thiamine pyrophosphate-dependent enzyme [Candidatus Kariarchaeaceae archaeon]|jgi:indolepyruvate ferredoxin oxidoreductase alpha subunit
MGRSYTEEYIESLLYDEGKTLTGDMAILFLKASLEQGISYAAGYPGAPTSNVMDLMGDAQEKVLKKYGVYFESSTNEAAAATKLYLSINDQIRGFVNWKVVGTNVASDILAHVSSSGVKGGAVILVGEDEECISTTVKMKSQLYGEGFFIPVMDPIGEAETIKRMSYLSYEFSEACNSPVFFLFRTLTGNMWGTAQASNNKTPRISMNSKADDFVPDLTRVPLPPDTLQHATEKYEQRLPKAIEFIRKHKINSLIKGIQSSKYGIITHGGVFNQVFTSLRELGLATLDGQSVIDILALNVTFPLDPQEIYEFAKGKDKILVIEQGMPNFIEHEVKTFVYDAQLPVRVYGKLASAFSTGYIPETDALSTDVLIGSIGEFFLQNIPLNGQRKILEKTIEKFNSYKELADNEISQHFIPRSPSFCTGCPERPVFSAIKKVEEERNERFVHLIDIGCYTMAKLPPFQMSDSCTGMGSSLDVAMGMTNLYNKNIVAVFGDGTLFHGGFRNIDNAIHNNLNKLYESQGVTKGDANVLLFILLNYHTAMTGDQENPATLFDFHDSMDKKVGKNLRGEAIPRVNLETVFKSHGAKWVKTVDPYDIGLMKKTIHKALDIPGLKIIISDGECMLEKQRHERPYKAKRLKEGKRWVDPATQVDDRLCSGCWPCAEYIGCPSEAKVKPTNPLQKGTIRQMDTSCVGCGVCSEVTQQFGLCPSTYNTYTVTNPGRFERMRYKISQAGIKVLRKL